MFFPSRKCGKFSYKLGAAERLKSDPNITRYSHFLNITSSVIFTPSSRPRAQRPSLSRRPGPMHLYGKRTEAFRAAPLFLHRGCSHDGWYKSIEDLLQTSESSSVDYSVRTISFESALLLGFNCQAFLCTVSILPPLLISFLFCAANLNALPFLACSTRVLCSRDRIALARHGGGRAWHRRARGAAKA